MKKVYSVKIDKLPPYHVKFISETNEDIDTHAIDKPSFNVLCQNNFFCDTNHDKTTNKGGIATNDAALSLACSLYPDRFNELIYMLVKKTEYKKINNGDYNVEVSHVDLNTSLEKNMNFIDFVKNILKIDFDEATIPQTTGNKIYLETCQNPPKDTPIRNFYTFLKLYDIRDMNRGFISARNSISFHIDSATSPDTLRLVPNICTQFYNGKFNIFGFILPGTGGGVGEFKHPENTKFSFLYFGDLMIADYYFDALSLGGIINGFEDFSLLHSEFYSFDEAPPVDAVAKNAALAIGIPNATPPPPSQVLFTGLCRYSLMSMNIFWQTLLSYMHVYIKLQIGDESNDIIQALRHWVFCGINYDNTKPSFTGKFIKIIVHDPTNVSYIAYWFLHAHHSRLPLPIGAGPPFNCHLMKNNSSVQEFDVTQGDCANYINQVCSHCNEDDIAIPRPGVFKKINLYKAISESFPFISKDITDSLNQLIIAILQILKYSGDMAHKLAVMIYRIIFSRLAAFNNFTPAVTTTDRPLIKDLFIDNIPGIITSANATILELSGIKNTFGYTVESLNDTGNVLFAFYLPVLQTDIFSLILKYTNKLNNYIVLLNKLYDPVSLCFQDANFSNKRESVTKIIVNVIYRYLTYITMFYLSLFSCEIHILGQPPGAGNLNDLIDGLAVGPPPAYDPFYGDYSAQYVNGNRVNCAWFVYLYYKKPFNTIKFANLRNTKFVGVDAIHPANTVIQTFLKNQTQLFISNATHAPDYVQRLNDVLSSHSYPVCFEIKRDFYTDPVGANAAAIALATAAKEQTLQNYVASLFSLYKDLVENRDKHPNLNYSAQIEKDFFEKMLLRTELGGIVPIGMDRALTEPLTMEVDLFYKGYLFFDSEHAFDDSLLRLSILYNKYDEITDARQEEKYDDLFKPLDADLTKRLMPDAGNAMFDSNFLYTYEYTHTTEFTPFNNPFTADGAKKCWALLYKIKNVHGIIHDTFFTNQKMVLTKVVDGDTFNYTDKGFYLFPFLRLHPDFIRGGIHKKVGRPFTIDKKFLNYTFEQNEAAMLIDIFNNLLKYVSDLNDFLDLYQSQIGLFKDAQNPLVRKIFQGVQCRFIIFFSLLMFNFRCNYGQILQIHHLFRSITDLYFLDEPLFSTNIDDHILAVKPDMYGRVRASNPKRYKRSGAKLTSEPNIFFHDPGAHLNPINTNAGIIGELNAVPPPSINCIGLFTTDPLHSNTLDEFDFTKIKGLYFIANKNLKLVYDELKHKLTDFFIKYDTHFGDQFYGDITFL